MPKNKPGVAIENDDYAWRHFYDFVCNSQNKQIEAPFDPQRHTLSELSEEHKLEIVLKMRQRKSSQIFAYLPTHLFSGDLCMILQERTFQQVPSKDYRNNSIFIDLREVTDDSKPSSGIEICFKAYEIAFGPVGDPTVRPPSIWFDIPKDDISPCTPQQAKHHKRSRHRIKKAPNRSNLISTETLTGDKFKTLLIPPFSIYQPVDHATFDLITSILVHRLKMTKLLAGKFDNSLQQIHEILVSEEEHLKRQFSSLFRHWISNSWPEEELVSPINDETDVPPVSMNYTCVVDSMQYSRSRECYGLASKRHSFDLTYNSKMFPCILWKSFTINMLLQKGSDIAYVSLDLLFSCGFRGHVQISYIGFSCEKLDWSGNEYSVRRFHGTNQPFTNTKISVHGGQN